MKKILLLLVIVFIAFVSYYLFSEKALEPKEITILNNPAEVSENLAAPPLPLMVSWEEIEPGKRTYRSVEFTGRAWLSEVYKNATKYPPTEITPLPFFFAELKKYDWNNGWYPDDKELSVVNLRGEKIVLKGASADGAFGGKTEGFFKLTDKELGAIMYRRIVVQKELAPGEESACDDGEPACIDLEGHRLEIFISDPLPLDVFIEKLSS